MVSPAKNTSQPETGQAEKSQLETIPPESSQQGTSQPAANQQGTNSGKSKSRQSKKRIRSEKTLAEIASEHVILNGTKARCQIDVHSGCIYEQRTFDAQNYVRHCRIKHPEVALLKGFFKNPEAVPKKRRHIAKRPIAIDRQLFLEAILKLISYHNMPLSSLDWEGLKQLLDPISDSLNIKVNRSNIKDHLSLAADKIRLALKEEMKGKLICLKIDSATRHGRSVLGVNVQYSLSDVVVVRTLGKKTIKYTI